MEKPEQVKEPNSERLNELADELDDLQKKENDGRGVGCVQSVVAYLKMGLLSEARQVCRVDHDKILNYPTLVEYIKSNLFDKGEEHPWSVLERLQEQGVPQNN